jgi:hypothetical protein
LVQLAFVDYGGDFLVLYSIACNYSMKSEEEILHEISKLMEKIRKLRKKLNAIQK